MIADLATERLVDTVSIAQADEFNSSIVDTVEKGFGLSIGVSGLASAVQNLVDGGGVVSWR